jgi:hypothetical protein
MLTPPLLLFFITSATLTLSSCATLQDPVEIKDEPLYYIKGNPTVPASFPDYAVEMHFLSSGQTDMTKAQIDPIIQGMVCLPAESFDDFNTEIGKLCSQVTCDYETMAKLAELVERLHYAAGSGLP